MIEENSSIYNRINQSAGMPVLTEGGKFAIASGDNIFYYQIRSSNPECISIAPYEAQTPYETPTLERLYKTKAQKEIRASAEVLYITDDRAGIAVYLKSGKCQRVLKRAYIDILRKKELLYEGAEFDIVYTEDDDGTSLKIMQKQDKPDIMLKNFYDDLLKNLDDKC